MEPYFLPSLYVDKSDISEYGIFTKDAIVADTLLYNCDDLHKYNRLLTFSGIASLPEYQKKIFLKFAYQIDDNMWVGPVHVHNINGHIDLDKQSDISIFWNHSCAPNTYFKAHNAIVAIRDIAVGEEMTYDYCTTDIFNFPYIFKKYMPYSDKCNCKSTICRGRVMPGDWMQPSLQKKYNGKFLPYIQKKINYGNDSFP